MHLALLIVAALSASPSPGTRWDVPGGAVRYSAPPSWGALEPAPPPAPATTGARIVARASFATHDPVVTMEVWTWDATFTDDPEPDPRDIAARIRHQGAADKEEAVRAFRALHDRRSVEPVLTDPPLRYIRPGALFWPGPHFALAAHHAEYLESTDGRLRGLLTLGTPTQELQFEPGVQMWLGSVALRRLLVLATDLGCPVDPFEEDSAESREKQHERYLAAEAGLRRRATEPPLSTWLDEIRGFARSVVFERP